MARTSLGKFPSFALILLSVFLRVGTVRAQDLDEGEISPDAPQVSVEEANHQCLSSHRQGQQLERSGLLLSAAQAYRDCLRPHCSPVLREDCGARHMSVKADTPTVILAVQHQGEDLADIAVYDGDVLLQDGLSGVAVPLDPGPHTLRFVAPDFTPYSHSFVARVGEKNRVIVVVLSPNEDDAERPSPPSSLAQPAPLAQPTPLAVRPSPVATPRPVWGPWEYGLFSTGAALGAGGIVLGVLALSDYRAAQSECAPTCSDQRLNGLRAKVYAADTMFALSATAVIAGSVRVVLGKRRERKRAALVFSPGFIGAEGRF